MTDPETVARGLTKAQREAGWVWWDRRGIPVDPDTPIYVQLEGDRRLWGSATQRIVERYRPRRAYKYSWRLDCGIVAYRVTSFPPMDPPQERTGRAILQHQEKKG